MSPLYEKMAEVTRLRFEVVQKELTALRLRGELRMAEESLVAARKKLDAAIGKPAPCARCGHPQSQHGPLGHDCSCFEFVPLGTGRQNE